MIDAVFTLKNCELFGGLSEEELSSIAIICSVVNAVEGERLFLEDQSAQNVYIVVSGKVALQKSLGHHRALSQRDAATIAFCQPDQIVGWSALVDPYRYTLSATAWEPTELLAIRASLLLRAMELNPDVGFRVMQALSEVMARRLKQISRALTAAREFRNGMGYVRRLDEGR